MDTEEKSCGRMNPDKINKWLDLAKSFSGNDFWSDIFEQPPLQDNTGRHSYATGKPGEGAWTYPPADVLTSEEEILVLADLPGVSKEDIQLSVIDEILYIKGEVKPLYPQCTTISSERFAGRFERPIELPMRIDGQTAKIRATFHSGTLIVRIPVSPSRKKEIPID